MMKENSNGFTLLETLLTLAIGTIVSTMFVVIIVNSGGLFYKQSSKVAQGLSINDSMAKIEQTIKQSAGVAANYASGGITYTSSTAQLVLKLPTVNLQGAYIDSTYDYFVFFLDGTKFRFKVFPDGASSRKSLDQIFSTNANRSSAPVISPWSGSFSHSIKLSSHDEKISNDEAIIGNIFLYFILMLFLIIRFIPFNIYLIIVLLFS